METGFLLLQASSMTPGPSQEHVQAPGELSCPEQPRAAPAYPDSQAPRLLPGDGEETWAGSPVELGEAAPWAGESCGWAWRIHWLAPQCMEPPVQPGSVTWDIQETSTVWGEQGFPWCPFLPEEGDFWQRQGHSTALALQCRADSEWRNPRGWSLAATRPLRTHPKAVRAWVFPT